MVDLIIYHGNCPDGFCAAFVAKKKYPDALLLPASYGQNPPIEECRSKNVLVVDFSWKRNVCEVMNEIAASFQILDHHKTAEAELGGLDYAIFDMNRSGATLTWDTLFPGEWRPWYVDYVEDRDLWRWKLANSKDISGYIMALPQTIEAWTKLDDIGVTRVAALGAAIRLHIDHYVEKVVEQAWVGSWCGHTVRIANAPYLNCSDVGDVLAGVRDIGLVWFERKDGAIQFSLRSKDEGPDVSEIAKMYGGGGHQHAAGFQIQHLEGRALLDMISGRPLDKVALHNSVLR